VTQRTYDERRNDERSDPDVERGPGHETYDEKVERWRRGWREEDRNGC
jgi:hypothetical protein